MLLEEHPACAQLSASPQQPPLHSLAPFPPVLKEPTIALGWTGVSCMCWMPSARPCSAGCMLPGLACTPARQRLSRAAISVPSMQM